MVLDKGVKEKCIKMHNIVNIWVNLNELLKQQCLRGLKVRIKVILKEKKV